MVPIKELKLTVFRIYFFWKLPNINVILNEFWNNKWYTFYNLILISFFIKFYIFIVILMTKITQDSIYLILSLKITKSFGWNPIHWRLFNMVKNGIFCKILNYLMITNKIVQYFIINVLYVSTLWNHLSNSLFQFCDVVEVVFIHKFI